jgi:hypothetical protein
MASQFQISVQSTKRGPRVRMTDVDMDDTTAWVQLPGLWRNAPAEVVVAAAMLKSDGLVAMMDAARSVAYAVYLEEDRFDVHRGTSPAQWASDTIAQYKRDQLSAVAHKASPAPPRSQPRLKF